MYRASSKSGSHLGHEANSEQLFSRSGNLSDDNGKMDPHRLAVWTSIGVNRNVYEPRVKEIMDRYFLKFSMTTSALLTQMAIRTPLTRPSNIHAQGSCSRRTAVLMCLHTRKWNDACTRIG